MNQDYKFISESNSVLGKILGTKILEMKSMTLASLGESSGWRRIIESNKRFELAAIRYYLTFEDVGTLAFASRGGDHRSLWMAVLPRIPEPENMMGEIFRDAPKLITSVDDPRYSEPYLASFLGTRVSRIETIQAHETGRKGARRNERGIRLTNDLGRQFLLAWNIRPTSEHGDMSLMAPEEMVTTPGFLSFENIPFRAAT